jgi:hypothetical protein
MIYDRSCVFYISTHTPLLAYPAGSRTRWMYCTDSEHELAPCTIFWTDQCSHVDTEFFSRELRSICYSGSRTNRYLEYQCAPLLILVRAIWQSLCQCRTPIITVVGGWIFASWDYGYWFSIHLYIFQKIVYYVWCTIDALSHICHRYSIATDSRSHSLDDRIYPSMAGIP